MFQSSLCKGCQYVVAILLAIFVSGSSTASLNIVLSCKEPEDQTEILKTSLILKNL